VLLNTTLKASSKENATKMGYGWTTLKGFPNNYAGSIHQYKLPSRIKYRIKSILIQVSNYTYIK